MKIFLTRKSAFTFRGVGSADLDLLGKSVFELMKERLRAESEENFTGEGVVLDPVFPFLTRERLFYYLDEREGSYRFAGGFVARAGEPMSDSPRRGTGELGPALFTLADLPAVLLEAARESAALHFACGALVEEGAAVDYTAALGRGTVVGRGSRVRGHSVVGENTEIICSDLENCEVGDSATVAYSVLVGVSVKSGAAVGPYVRLGGRRPF